jgi:DNA modification methylase
MRCQCLCYFVTNKLRRIKAHKEAVDTRTFHRSNDKSLLIVIIDKIFCNDKNIKIALCATKRNVKQILPRENMIKIIEGDSRIALKRFAENTFTGIVTDPPYGLSFMGNKWDYNVPSKRLWKECLRVVKPGGYMLCFGGTRTYHRMVVEIEDAGWLIKDCMMWVYGSGFPKSLNIGKSIDNKLGVEHKVVGKWKPTGTAKPNKGKKGHSAARTSSSIDQYERESDVMLNVTEAASPQGQQWKGHGTALKPAWEPIIVCMKPTDGIYADNALWHGVAGLNIEGSRVSLNGELKSSGGQSKGKSSFMKNIGDAPRDRTKGRWPANFIMTHSDQCKLVGTKRLKKKNYAISGGYEEIEDWRCAPDCPSFLLEEQNPGIPRFFYCAKPNNKERGDKNVHPTVKPLDLMSYLVNLIKMPNNTHILEPFAGSGTTLAACMAMGIDCTGIERENKYVEIIRERLGLL